jgi:hypothetical protein
MNLAADVGRHSGRATPSLHDTPHRHFEETTGRQSTYLLPITVQTNRTTSLLYPGFLQRIEMPNGIHQLLRPHVPSPRHLARMPTSR